MSSPGLGEDVALLQQAYIKYLLESDEMYVDVPILAEDEGNIVSQMDRALGIATRKEGVKSGACCIIRQPVGDDTMSGVRNPPLFIEWEVMFLEHRDMNKHATFGTQKRAWHLARRAWTILKAHRAPGLLQNIVARHPTIYRYSAMREQMGGVEVPLVGYAIRFATNEADNSQYQKVNLPLPTGTPALTTGVIYTGSIGGTLEFASSTPGASIYYTTDQSNPCAQNPSAQLYTGAITVAEAKLYLARAFLTGYIGSDAVAVQFT